MTNDVSNDRQYKKRLPPIPIRECTRKDRVGKRGAHLDPFFCDGKVVLKDLRLALDCLIGEGIEVVAEGVILAQLYMAYLQNYTDLNT